MKSRLISKNVVIKGHRTSLRLESGMWEAMDDLCALEGLTRDGLCDLVEESHEGQNRSSAIRAFVVTYFHELSTKVNGNGNGGRMPSLLDACQSCDRIDPQRPPLRDHLETTVRVFRGL